MASLNTFSALTLAQRLHAGQYRDNGDPVFTHIEGVLDELFQLSVDLPRTAYITAILHDTLEDTPIGIEELEEAAGSEVCHYVAVLSKRIGASRKNLPEAVYVDRLLDAAQSYPFLLLIKLADRLDNAKTLDALSDERASKWRTETLDLYIPAFDELAGTFPARLRHPLRGGLRLLSERLHKPCGEADISSPLRRATNDSNAVSAPCPPLSYRVLSAA